jgi:tetrahydromethanopterin S-methyltransferase subunit A
MCPLIEEKSNFYTRMKFVGLQRVITTYHTSLPFHIYLMMVNYYNNQAHLILCGKDERGHRPGNSLIALSHNGITKQGKIIMSKSPILI